MGSASETEYHLILAQDLGYISDDFAHLHVDIVTVKKMLASLIGKLRD